MTRDDLAFSYLAALPFEPYPFQEEAIFAWFSSEQGVLVCAPTGMGKTLIAEAGLYEALQTGKRAYYTSPLIALTEQKYREIQAAAVRWGFSEKDVGLVTGNRKENADAPILVVVAEILFNRLVSQNASFDDADSFDPITSQRKNPFEDVVAVVMDEFHYFSDFERGAVWEFSLELLPPHVRTLLISATVGNSYDFVAWLRESSGRRLQLVESFQRKVPLSYHWVGDDFLLEHLETMHRSQGAEDDSRLTPALVFCFNRDDCWNVADQIRGRNVIDAQRQKTLTAILENYPWSQGAGPKIRQLLLRGVGVHHAGVLPKYRRIIEELFQQKLLSVCVCTETLAAGINLPARSVVLPSLVKGPPGEKKLIDSSTAHQIFGRAGRPQYDTQGFVFSLAHEDDVKIARFKKKYDQIPEDTKDPKLRAMKKKMKKKMPTRRQTEQYWTESQFHSLCKMPPGKLTSRGDIPIRMLAYLIERTSDIAMIRKLVAKRFMGAKRLQEGQRHLDDILTTLWKAGFIQLSPPPYPDEEKEKEKEKVKGKEHKSDSVSPAKFASTLAYPELPFPKLLHFRSTHPLYGLFMVRELGIADRAERIQAFEAMLEMPYTVGRYVRVPRLEELPSGPLARTRLDVTLLDFGLATAAELVGMTDEEKEAERQRHRQFGPIPEEDRVFVLKFAEKLHRLFQFEFPTIQVRTFPVWAAGELVMDFHGDFNKYITSKGLQKQEGIVFRHLLRLILLLDEFLPLVPPETTQEEWQTDLSEIRSVLVSSCHKVDPTSTEKEVGAPLFIP